MPSKLWRPRVGVLPLSPLEWRIHRPADPIETGRNGGSSSRSHAQRKRAVGLVCLGILAASLHSYAQAQGAGRIKVVSGAASIVRQGQVVPAEVGAVVHESDVLRTGSDGHLAVMLKDETRLSLGPQSELALAKFAYAPSDGRLGLVLKMARGVLAYVSGRIAKLMPESVQLETPTSVIGVRGTHALLKVEAP